MASPILALDLERTLIDNAMSCQPRPGLREFLLFCDRHFERVAIFTTVDEADARAVVGELASRGLVPPGLLDRLEFVDWAGEYKDLNFVSAATPGNVILIDDDAGWIRPDQRSQWIPIAPWDAGPDADLARVALVLEERT